MPVRSGPFSVYEIAQELAHQPLRLFNGISEEAFNAGLPIAEDMFERFRRGEFADHEVLVQEGLFPRRYRPLTEARTAETFWFGPSTKIDLEFWYTRVGLIYPAAKRYLEDCPLGNAQLLLDRWFNSSSTAQTPREPRMGVALTPPLGRSHHRAELRRKTGPAPTKRLATEAAMKAEIAVGTLSIEALDKLKEEAMASRYKVSRDTARKARRNVLSELVGPELRQSSTIDK